MQTYILRRLLALVPTLFIASVIVFVIVRMVPGDVVDLMLSQNDAGSNKLTRDQLLETMGLDKPMWEQYGIWISALVFRGDLGNSLWQGDSVVSMIAARLPVTFELGLLAMVIALTVAIPVGVYSAVRQDTAGDYVARSFSLLMLAVPSFWVGTMITVFPSIWWGWSPEIHFVPFHEDPWQNLQQLIIPAVILGLSLSAITMRMTRTMMLEGHDQSRCPCHRKFRRCRHGPCHRPRSGGAAHPLGFQACEPHRPSPESGQCRFQKNLVAAFPDRPPWSVHQAGSDRCRCPGGGQ